MLNSSKKFALIGLGNTLRRDDGIGIYVLSSLQERLDPTYFSLLDFGIASFGLVNTIQDFKKVLLIDAMHGEEPPGTLRIFKLEDASYLSKEKKLSSHELSLGDVLNLCKKLKVKSEVYVAGIQVKDASYGLDLTQELKTAQHLIVKKIEEFVSSWGV